MEKGVKFNRKWEMVDKVNLNNKLLMEADS